MRANRSYNSCLKHKQIVQTLSRSERRGAHQRIFSVRLGAAAADVPISHTLFAYECIYALPRHVGAPRNRPYIYIYIYVEIVSIVIIRMSDEI